MKKCDHATQVEVEGDRLDFSIYFKSGKSIDHKNQIADYYIFRHCPECGEKLNEKEKST